MGPFRLGRCRRNLPTYHQSSWCRFVHVVELALELCKLDSLPNNESPFLGIFVLTLLFQIIAVITPYLVGTEKGDAALGSNIFFMWGGLCVVSLLFTYFLVPETKGLSLEQVDRMLEETTPRTSTGWKPHSTFAAEMHLEEKRLSIPYASGVETETITVSGEKSAV